MQPYLKNITEYDLFFITSGPSSPDDSDISVHRILNDVNGRFSPWWSYIRIMSKHHFKPLYYAFEALFEGA